MHLCQVNQEEEAKAAMLLASSSLAITGNKAWQTRMNKGVALEGGVYPSLVLPPPALWSSWEQSSRMFWNL